MHSPAINDDWVAIKEFPLLSGKIHEPLDDVDGIESGKEFQGTTSLGHAQSPTDNEASWSNNGGHWKYSVTWLNELNVMQISYNPGNSSFLKAQRITQESNNNGSDSKTYISELSVEKVANIHEQLCLLCQSLTGLLPDLPAVPRGVWSYVSSVYIPENFEEDMITYLQNARKMLGDKIFLESFFQQETVTEDEYLENLGDLNRKAFAESVKDAKQFLEEVLSLRDGSINIHDMITLYSLEDEALERIEVAKAVLYNFDRQPFLDLREVAHQQLKYAIEEFKKDDLPDEQKSKLDEECNEWRRQLAENEENLLELQLQFFESSLNFLIEGLDRMFEDEMRFGKEAFQNSSAPLRLRQKSKEASSLSVQLLRSRRIKLLADRGKIRRDVVGLEENENLETEIVQLEKVFFKKQVEIYDLDLKIVEEEENLLRLHLKEFLKVDVADNEEDIFFEAFEEQPEDFEREDIPSSVEDENEKKRREELKKKQELSRKLSRLFRKRAWLRNKKRKCEGDMKRKICAKQQAEENFKWHHAIQIKRDKNKEELETKKDFIQDMRKKTIERLKSFKKKYPDPVIKRPPRYLPPVRRTRSGRSSPAPNQNSSVNGSRPSVSAKVLAKYEEAKKGKDNQFKTGSSKSIPTDESQGYKASSILPPPPQLTIPPPTPSPPPPPTVAPPPPAAPQPPPPPPPLIHSKEHSKYPLSVDKKRDAGPTKNKTNEDTKLNKKECGKGKNEGVDLNQIIFARQNLRKNVENPSDTRPQNSANDDIMSMIRTGVKLKKVDQKELVKQKGLSDIAASMLRTTLAKMNKHMADTDDEDDDENGSGEEFI